MRTRTTAATVTLITGLFLATTACGSSSPHPAATTTTPTTAAAYNPTIWKTRIDNLVTLMDQNQNECMVSPSSDACAEVLRAADTQMLQMKEAVDSNGGATSHPQTTDTLGKILDGYNGYISGFCPGGLDADDQGSDCRVSMVTVMLGVATLSSKMTLDGDQ